MNANNFTKVFDVLDSGYKDWSFSAPGLIFILIGAVMFFDPRFFDAMAALNKEKAPPKWLKQFLRYFFFGFSILWTAGSFYSTYREYHRHQKFVKAGTCVSVEGQVQNFIPMPYTGHSEESFNVQGVHFKYSDYRVLYL